MFQTDGPWLMQFQESLCENKLIILNNKNYKKY